MIDYMRAEVCSDPLPDRVDCTPIPFRMACTVKVCCYESEVDQDL